MVAIYGLEKIEPKLAAQSDYENFWKGKIDKAKSKGATNTDNHKWWSNGRCDEAYVEALQVVLGQKFKVEYVTGQWGGQCTKVSW